MSNPESSMADVTDAEATVTGTTEPMDEAACLRSIATGDEDAYSLLMAADPKFKTRFKRLNTAIVELLKDVREYFPDAQYYTASGGFNLMLGASHSASDRAQQQLIALGGSAQIGDGDF